MKKKRIFISLLLFVLVSFPIVLALENSITGDVVFSMNPNDLQKVYSKSSPAIAKLNIYYEYDISLPKLKSIDFKYDFDYEYPLYEDLKVRMDSNSDGFEDFFGESFWDDFYAGEYYSFDELGEVYLLEYSTNEINQLKEEFYSYHDNVLPLFGGTGFLVNPEGYILTNAHVATLLNSELESVTEIILYSNYLDYYNLLYTNANYNDDISMDKYENYLKRYLFLIENMKIENVRISKIEVILGEGDNINKYIAELIDSNNNYLDEIGGRDWALLKIDGENFPSLPLGNSDNVPIGEDIIVIGYPWTSEGFTEKKEVFVASTPTSGKVSNIVPSGEYKDIQIDISIESGNSGGPGLNLRGEVIGIATAGYEGLTGTYNYLTPINDVKKAVNINLKQSKIDNLWNNGLENFWNENYITAKLEFEEVKSINPRHPYVEAILTQLKSLPNTDKNIVDNNQVVDEDNLNKGGVPIVQIIFIIIGIVTISLLLYIAFNLNNGKPKKRKKKWHDVKI